MSSWQQSPNNTTGPDPRAFNDTEMSSHQAYVDAHGHFHNVNYMPGDLTLDPRLSNAVGGISGNMATDTAEQQMLRASWNPNFNNHIDFFDNSVHGATSMNCIGEHDRMVAPETITSRGTSTTTRRTKTPSPSETSNPTPRTRSMASSRSSVPSTNSAPSVRNQKARKESRKGKQQAPRQRKQSNASLSSWKNSLPEEDQGILDEDDSTRDRFLERNRIAASKCRQKKKVWVHDLEGSKQELENYNNSLHLEHNALISELTGIKNMLMSHANCHDPNIDQWLDNEARRFVQKTADKFSAMNVPEPAIRARYPKRESLTLQPSPPNSTGSHPTPIKPDEDEMNYDHMPDAMFDDGVAAA